MKKGLANLSDLELAGNLSRKLSVQKPTGSKEEPASADNYLRFTLAPRADAEAAKDSAATEAKRAGKEEKSPALTFKNWDKLLSWCLSISQAESVFVVDSQGFVITSWGKISADGFEGMGAELRLAIEQLELINPDAGKVRWIDLEFNKSGLVVFRSSPDDTKDFLFGFITYRILGNDEKIFMDQVISRNLHNLS